MRPLDRLLRLALDALGAAVIIAFVYNAVWGYWAILHDGKLVRLETCEGVQW